jgi:hypothetical protein
MNAMIGHGEPYSLSPSLEDVGGMSGTLKTPVDELARIARSKAQGYIHDMFHATKKNFSEFSPAIRTGGYENGDFGIHVTPRAETANNVLSIDNPLAGGAKGANIMPLKVRMNKTLHMPKDVGLWQDPVSWTRNPDHDFLASNTNDYLTVRKLIDSADEIRAAYAKGSAGNINPEGRNGVWQHKMKEVLQEKGYDSVSYPNTKEGAGENSYMLLDPRQIKSKFAKFAPEAFMKSKDIMSSVIPPALVGLAASREKDKK